jgi:hypothetical protein
MEIFFFSILFSLHIEINIINELSTLKQVIADSSERPNIDCRIMQKLLQCCQFLCFSESYGKQIENEKIYILGLDILELLLKSSSSKFFSSSTIYYI